MVKEGLKAVGIGENRMVVCLLSVNGNGSPGKRQRVMVCLASMGDETEASRGFQPEKGSGVYHGCPIRLTNNGPSMRFL